VLKGDAFRVLSMDEKARRIMEIYEESGHLDLARVAQAWFVNNNIFP